VQTYPLKTATDRDAITGNVSATPQWLGCGSTKCGWSG